MTNSLGHLTIYQDQITDPEDLDVDVIRHIHETAQKLPDEEKSPAALRAIVSEATGQSFFDSGESFNPWLRKFMKRVQELNLPV